MMANKIGRPRQIDDAKVARFYLKGHTQSDIARKLGVTQPAVHYSLKRQQLL